MLNNVLDHVVYAYTFCSFQFYKLYDATESGVVTLKRSKVNGQANRIVLSVDDGSIRILSPQSGTTLSIVYPLPFYKVIVDLMDKNGRNYGLNI